MSAPKPMKALSLRDSLATTVRLLTRQGVDVRFRGHQPYVRSRGGKVLSLTLPELNDDAPEELIEAIQGFLDHEVGHIFYTPFARAEKFGRKNARRGALANIIEDIRLEKLMPRDLPGTKENLERMYDSVMPTFFGPPALRANEPGVEPSEAFGCVMVAAMRALAGQKAFQRFMDDNNLWRHFEPLLVKMPDLSKRLLELEEYRQVERLVDDIIEAMKPPASPETEDKENKEKQQGNQPDDGDQDEDDDGASNSSDDGEGHGEGSGTDDGDDEDAGTCSGDGDEEGDDTGDGDSESDTPADNDLEGNPRGDSQNYGEGKQNMTLKEALSQLEPRQRRALFLYKRKRKTVAEIAADLRVSEDAARDLVATARRKLHKTLNGG